MKFLPYVSEMVRFSRMVGDSIPCWAGPSWTGRPDRLILHRGIPLPPSIPPRWRVGEGRRNSRNEDCMPFCFFSSLSLVPASLPSFIASLLLRSLCSTILSPGVSSFSLARSTDFLFSSQAVKDSRGTREVQLFFSSLAGPELQSYVWTTLNEQH